MKRLFLLIVILLFVCSNAYAGRVLDCNWIWSTAVTSTTDDPPDSVYCMDTNETSPSFKDKGAAYWMDWQGAYEVTAQIDTTSTGSLSQNGVTVCSNTGAVSVNFHGSLDKSNPDSGSAYFWQVASFADADAKTYPVTAIKYAKITVTEGSGNNGCVVVRTSAYWK